MKLIIALVMGLAGFFGGGYALAENNRLIEVLANDDHFALMRHALAPGTGDPSGFKVDDCSTQRNLNASGRAQAVQIGEFLRSQPGLSLSVYSSQWCRCLETARLLEAGDVTSMAALNSFFADRSSADSQTQATKEWLGTAKLPVLLVTHQVNISALTGVYPASGEIVVMKREADGTLVVVGSIEL